MTFWDSDDYRSALKIKIEERKRFTRKTTNHALAVACKIDKAYLSRVLKQDADLSQDQVYLAAKYLGVGGLEQDFLFALHAYSRSSLAERRHELKQKLASIRANALETQRHIITDSVSGEEQSVLAPYFLDADVQLAHVFLTSERFRRNPKAIGEALGLSGDRLTGIIDLLRRLGLVETTTDGLTVKRDSLHLPTSAPTYHAHRLLMRQRGLARTQVLGNNDGYFFSVVFSATRNEEQAIRRRFMELISASEADVKRSPADHIYQMSFDLFQWSK